MQQWIIQFGTHHQDLIYGAVLLIAIVEGPILSMIFGVLLRLGYFSLAPVYITLMLGDIIGDTGWYYLGYHYGRAAIKRFGSRFGITDKEVEKAEKLFHGHTYKILFISKITNGFGLSIVTLLTAGITRVPFRKYLATNVAGQLIWSGLLIAAGYFFSDSYMRINSIFGKIGLVAIIAAVIFVIARYAIKLHKKLAQ